MWTRWTNWECSVSCGSGVEARTRICMRGTCEGPSRETRECQQPPCPVGAPPSLVEEANKLVQENSKSYQVKKGEELSLVCMGRLLDYIQKVYPGFKAAWYHNEEIFRLDKGRTGLIDFNKDLIISKALPKDNGVWTCQVRIDEKSQLFTASHAIAVENDVPDIQIKEGDSFEMPCFNGGLARFYHSGLVAQWYHNTGAMETSSVDSGVDHELGVRSSTVTDNGIWKCKVSQVDVAQPKSWVTNVVKVEVVSLHRKPDLPTGLHTKTPQTSENLLNGNKDSKTFFKVFAGNNNVLVAAAILVLIVVGFLWCCWLRKRRGFKSLERSVGRGRKRKLQQSKNRKKYKSPKNIFSTEDEDNESRNFMDIQKLKPPRENKRALFSENEDEIDNKKIKKKKGKKFPSSKKKAKR